MGKEAPLTFGEFSHLLLCSTRGYLAIISLGLELKDNPIWSWSGKVLPHTALKKRNTYYNWKKNYKRTQKSHSVCITQAFLPFPFSSCRVSLSKNALRPLPSPMIAQKLIKSEKKLPDWQLDLRHACTKHRQRAEQVLHLSPCVENR